MTAQNTRQITTGEVAANTQLRSLRLGLGLTQAELAERVCDAVELATGRRPAVDAQAISRMECGEITWPRRATREALLTVLACEDVSDLGLHPQRTSKDAEKDDATKRRGFLALAGLAAPVALAGHQPGAIAQVGYAELKEMRDRFARLVQLDNHLGGADTYHLYYSELARTEAALRQVDLGGTLATRLNQLASEQAQQAGWAAFDAGFGQVANGLFGYGHRTAQAAGDRALATNALIHRAYASEDPAAIREADAACSALDERIPATARALLQSRRAWSCARAGQRNQSIAALDAAREALLKAAPDEPTQSWYGWIDHAELDIMTGRVWSVLRRPDSAIAPLSRALENYPDHWARDKALYLTWLADAQLEAGDIDSAVSSTEAALTLGFPVASARPLARVRAVAQRLTGMGISAGSDLLARATAVHPPIPGAL